MAILRSEECKELFAALSKFAGLVQSPTKDAKNAYVGNKYASIGEVLGVARPALAQCGLALTQSLSTDGDYVVIETLITHESGQWMAPQPLVAKPVRAPKGQAPFTLSADEATTQEKCAAYTYLRRYAVLAALGIAAEDDTDGEPERVEPQQQQQNRQQSQQREPERQQQERPKSEHKTGPEVDAIVKSLDEAQNETALAILAMELITKHGPIATTVPWIKFQKRCEDRGLAPRAVLAVAKKIWDEREAEASKAEAGKTPDTAQA